MRIEIDINTGVLTEHLDLSPIWSLEDLRAAKLAAISAMADALLAAGTPVADGLNIALDNGSRADLTAMGAVAVGAMAGVMVWPEEYSLGWITEENVRFPLPTPQVGSALVERACAYYAAIIQHRRDLKDSALAAEDATALDAIDVDAGWPAA